MPSVRDALAGDKSIFLRQLAYQFERRLVELIPVQKEVVVLPKKDTVLNPGEAVDKRAKKAQSKRSSLYLEDRN